LDVDAVGSQVGNEMKKSAVIAVLLSLVGMILYLTLRFEFGFALGAFVALAHDVLITIGVYLTLGNQISLTIVAALLTIVGYSVNDTIVIFDRIREELKKDQRTNIDELCNRCVNLTLSRTILTSVTTLLTVVSLLIFGKGDIKDFAVTMVIGIITGTLSTVFIATPVMLAWHRHKRPTFGKV
jgi:preprotein translocase SecF subunit